MSRAGDQPVTFGANGFNLAGTLSKPKDAAPTTRLPAVVLIAGSGPLDRDEMAYGIPVFAQFGITPQTSLKYGVTYSAIPKPGDVIPDEMLDEIVARELVGAFRADLRRSTELTREEWIRRPWYDRVWEWTAYRVHDLL